MKILFNRFRYTYNDAAERFSDFMASQPSPIASFIGILLWVGASANIVISFIYVLRESDMGAFVSITMLVSLFYLVFTSLASNFDQMGKRVEKK